MSYTIQATPPSLSSVHGDLVYTVAYPEHTSDPVTYPNYKFVGDIYINGVFVNRIKKIPNPVNNIGVFDVSNIVRNYLAMPFSPVANQIMAQRSGNGEFYVKVTMKFGEEYSFAITTNLVVDSQRTFFNNYNTRGQLTSLDGMADKFLTNRPASTRVRCDGLFNLISYLPSTTTNFTVTFRSYDYNNTLYGTATELITPGSAYELIVFDCSPSAINTLLPGMVDNNVRYLTVSVGSQTIRFERECECKYEKYTLHFMNKLGALESKDFTKVSRKTIQIDRRDFGKLPYSIDVSGVVSYRNSNNVYNESRSVYSSQFKERLTLNSDFLTDAEYRWLQELVLSTLVYVEQDGYFYPVVITDNNYEPKKVVNDELTNLTLSVEFGEQLNAQYR